MAANHWGKLKGYGFVVLALLTTSQTIAILSPILLCYPLAPKVVDTFFHYVGASFFGCVALYMEMSGIKIFLYGDAAHPDAITKDAGKLLIVLNHYCRLDWLFVIPFEIRLKWSLSKVAVLKSPLRNIPGIGWAMQCLRYLFLERDWSKDKARFQRVIQAKAKDNPMSVFLFPEGTDLSQKNIERSHAFSDERGLAKYHHVLHPRAKGMTAIIKHMRGENCIDSVWDLTMGYTNFANGSGEKEFLSGQWPTELHFHVKRHAIREVPEDDDEMANWIKREWSLKEKLLADFHARKGSSFGDSRPNNVPFPWLLWIQLLSPLYIVCNFILFPYLIFTYGLIRWFVILSSILWIMAAPVFGGADSILVP